MSNVVVVDASLAIKWVLSETDSALALLLLNKWIREGKEVKAPALFSYEVTNILYRRFARGLLTYEEAIRILVDLFSFTVSLDFSLYQNISAQAMKLAHNFNLPATYDAHYLALAERENCELWTADTRLWNSVKNKLTWVYRLSDYQP